MKFQIEENRGFSYDNAYASHIAVNLAFTGSGGLSIDQTARMAYAEKLFRENKPLEVIKKKLAIWDKKQAKR